MGFMGMFGNKQAKQQRRTCRKRTRLDIATKDALPFWLKALKVTTLFSRQRSSDTPLGWRFLRTAGRVHPEKVATACLMSAPGQNQKLIDDHPVRVVIESEFEG
jgi:hypothetical protein